MRAGHKPAHTTSIQALDLYDVMGELCGAGSSPLRCLSLGPLTDIARLLIADTRQGTSLGLNTATAVGSSGYGMMMSRGVGSCCGRAGFVV